MKLTDSRGLPVSTDSVIALERYELAMRQTLGYVGNPIEALDEALAEDPDFGGAHALRADLAVMSSEQGALSLIQASVEAMSRPGSRATPREQAHVRAAEAWLEGRFERAVHLYGEVALEHPRDLIALQAAHIIDFYLGDSILLRDHVAQAMPYWNADVPGYGYLLGMYAFGLEESGDYARAEEFGRRAVDSEPLDCWAHHAVAHVMEMQGRAQDGIGWMIAREPYWATDDNFFKIHNWWHRALCHLDLGQVDAVLRLYDGPIRKSASVVALDLVDASALLWRLSLTGHGVGNRWAEVAQCWDQHADGHRYPFNDWHAVMAYLGAGRDDEVERVVRALERTARDDTDIARWAQAVALPLIQGFRAFWRCDYRRCAESLHPARFIVNQFGGSHAQRDVIDWTLTEAAVRGGLADLAEALAHERLAVKPHSPINRAFLRRAQALLPAGG
jgi:tetratricopeptide (TPR) repeat protein